MRSHGPSFPSFPSLSGMALLVVAIFFAVAALTSGSAEARHVYLNGVKLDDNVAVKPQTFVGCDVRIDAKGDIHIIARGYKVSSTEAGGSAPAPAPQPPLAPAPEPPPAPRVAPAPSAPPAPVTPVPPPARSSGPRPTWLISKETQRGATQYDVEVFINDALVKKVRSVDDPVLLDVSRWIQTGENRVRMVAIKQLGDRRVSSSAADTLEVIVGQGNAGGGTVTVDKVLVTFRRNANEVQNIREDFTFRIP